jgi:hypothetical protein
MAKRSKQSRKRAPKKLRVFVEFSDLHDLVDHLTETYNGYASITDGELSLLDAEWVREMLPQTITGNDLETLVSDPFSQGILMGRLAYLFDAEQLQVEKDETES